MTFVVNPDYAKQFEEHVKLNPNARRTNRPYRTLRQVRLYVLVEEESVDDYKILEQLVKNKFTLYENHRDKWRAFFHSSGIACASLNLQDFDTDDALDIDVFILTPSQFSDLERVDALMKWGPQYTGQIGVVKMAKAIVDDGKIHVVTAKEVCRVDGTETIDLGGCVTNSEDVRERLEVTANNFLPVDSNDDFEIVNLLKDNDVQSVFSATERHMKTREFWAATVSYNVSALRKDEKEEITQDASKLTHALVSIATALAGVVNFHGDYKVKLEE